MLAACRVPDPSAEFFRHFSAEILLDCGAAMFRCLNTLIIQQFSQISLATAFGNITLRAAFYSVKY